MNLSTVSKLQLRLSGIRMYDERYSNSSLPLKIFNLVLMNEYILN